MTVHSSRERILAHLKRRPGTDVEALAQSLNLAPMTIRQHLARMQGEGLLVAESERRPTGRPAHVYSLTPNGDDQFPKAYDRLAALLLQEVTTLDAGDIAGLSQADKRTLVMRRMAERAAAPYLERLRRMDGRERALAAAEIMQEESGFVEVESSEDGLAVRDYNCIYGRVAQANDDLCTFHTAYAGRLMGAPVELTSCQFSGAEACCFRVTL